MSKLGLHVNVVARNLVSFMREAKPKVVKFLDHDVGTIKACKEASPNTIFIGRLFTGDQRFQNPKDDAIRLTEKILPYADTVRGIYEAWEAYNELEPPNETAAKQFNEFHVHFAEQMHKHGLKTIAFNFSAGTPKLEMWQYYQDAAEASDYIGLHEYDAPTLDRIHKQGLAEGNGGMWLCLRYRRMLDLLRPSARKPIFITECGIDAIVNPEEARKNKLGWKTYQPELTPAQYMKMLEWYDNEIARDDLLIGATVFCFGQRDDRWNTFDLENNDEAREAFKQLLLRPMPAVEKRAVGAAAPTTGATAQQISGTPIIDLATQSIAKKVSETAISSASQSAISPASWFASRYASDQQLSKVLGQPIAGEQTVPMAEQAYQKGAMLYRGDTKQITMLTEQGAWSAYADTWNESQQAGKFFTAPAGLIEPVRGFGKVWREQLGGPNAAIGWGVEGERGYDGRIQKYERGTVILNDRGQTYALLSNGSWV
jgi:hypothetical protein